MSIHLEIKNIKNIQYADLFLPSQKGMYALVGENGCGKSTIMLALSLMIKKSSNKFSPKILGINISHLSFSIPFIYM